MTPNEWANFWRNEVGVNVIPAVTATKKPKVEWKQWQTQAIPDALHQQWLDQDTFKDGLAIICGQVWHNEECDGLWLNGIDCDNRTAIDEMCPNGIGKVAELTLVEQHDNPDKCHILFYTYRPLQSQAPLSGGGDDIPKLEIKSGGRMLLYCAGGVHGDGSSIEIIGAKRVKKVENVDGLEERLDQIFKRYNLEYLKPQDQIIEFQKPVYEVQGPLHEGNNRGVHILSYLDSKKIKNPELTESDLVYFARKYESENCVGRYDDDKILALVKQAMGYGQQKLVERAMVPNTKDDKEALIDNTAAEIERRHKFVTLRKTDEILMWNGKIYNKAAAESIIKEETETIVEYCKTGHRYEVINKIKAQTYTDNENFDADPRINTLENGLLNLDTMELTPHTPNHLSRVLLPIEFIRPEHDIYDDTIFEDIETNLGGTLFWQFLKRSFTIDGQFRQTDFETMLEVAASVFVKKPIDERAFMNLGSGENGKSVFLEYIERCLGDDNMSRITLQDIAEDTFMRAELEGKSANIFTDLEQNELRKTGKVKAIISGEPIEVQRKHQQPFMLKPYCKMIFSCNRFPKVYDQSQGFFRRWVIVKWDRNFEGDTERDGLLKDKLNQNKEERNKVVSCLLYLSRKLAKTGQFSHSKDWKTIQKEWNANADPVDGFVREYIIDSEHNTPKREMYNFYKQVMFEKGETPLGMGQFSRALMEYYDDDILRGTGIKTERVWLNVEIKRPVQADLSSFEG